MFLYVNLSGLKTFLKVGWSAVDLFLEEETFWGSRKLFCFCLFVYIFLSAFGLSFQLYKKSHKSRSERHRAARHFHLPPFPFRDIITPVPRPLFPTLPGIIGGEYDQWPNLPHGLLPRPRYDPIGPMADPAGRHRSDLRRATGGRATDVRRGFIWSSITSQSMRTSWFKSRILQKGNFSSTGSGFSDWIFFLWPNLWANCYQDANFLQTIRTWSPFSERLQKISDLSFYENKKIKTCNGWRI